MNYNELYKKAQQALMEHKVHVKDWCARLVEAYDALPEEGKKPLPGRTVEEMLPSLFKEPFDEEQYNVEASALKGLQAELMQTAERLNQEEAQRCLLL